MASRNDFVNVMSWGQPLFFEACRTYPETFCSFPRKISSQQVLVEEGGGRRSFLEALNGWKQA